MLIVCGALFGGCVGAVGGISVANRRWVTLLFTVASFFAWIASLAAMRMS